MIHERTAGRVLLVAPDLATMLVLGRDPSDPDRDHFYWTPGGGIDDGESIEVGTRRELFEETGASVVRLGRPVLERVAEFEFGGRRIRQREQFFHVEVAATFDAEPVALTDLEHAAILGFVWRTPAEMRNDRWQVYPECLPDLVESIAADGIPVTPWRVA